MAAARDRWQSCLDGQPTVDEEQSSCGSWNVTDGHRVDSWDPPSQQPDPADQIPHLRLLQVQVRRRGGVELRQLHQMNLLALPRRRPPHLVDPRLTVAISGNVIPTPAALPLRWVIAP